MLGNAARTVVPEFMYREYKALYLELREGDATGRTLGQRTSCPLLWRRIHGLRNGRDVRCPSARRAGFGPPAIFAFGKPENARYGFRTEIGQIHG